MFKPYRHSTAADYVTKQIENLIIEEKFKPGDRLPNETMLGESLGVGRSTVRESLRELERMGLIKTVRGAKGGHYISEVGGQVAGDTLRLLLQLKKVTLEELLEARKINESSAAALAAERRNQQDLSDLFQTLEIMERDLDSKSSFVKVNYDFHHIVTRSSKNGVIVVTLQALKDLIYKYFEPIPAGTDGFKVALQQHRAIYDAIEHQDAAAARMLMVQHLEEFGVRAAKY